MKRNENGFTLVEIIIGIFIVGILAAIIIPNVFGGKNAASTAACLADIDAFASDVEILKLTGSAPTQAEVRDGTRWSSTFEDFWYLPNNSDFNSGHGNDLDGCDEENPGKSSANRECIPMRFLIVCNHDHEDAKYVFKVDGMPPQIVPDGDERPVFTRSMQWWTGKDPHYQKWFGRTATN